MPTFQTFKDLSVTFKKHPVTDDVITVKDKAAIMQSISNLLLTNKGGIYIYFQELLRFLNDKNCTFHVDFFDKPNQICIILKI